MKWFARFTTLLKRLMVPPLELYKALRWSYWPLLLGYFAHSFSGMHGMGSGLTTIPASFWVKDDLLLSPAQMAFISFTVGLPWISKILFGQLVDSWSMTTRKRVLFGSGGVMMIGFWLLASLAGQYEWLMKLRSLSDSLVVFQYTFLTTGYLLVSAAMCLQDVILDPLSRHIVSRFDYNGNELSGEEYKHKVGVVQVWCRISFNLASIFGMIVAGRLMAYGVHMEYIFLAAMFVPVMSVMFAQFISLPHELAVSSSNKRIIFSALGIVTVAVLVQVFDLPYSREVSFVVTLGVIVYLLRMLSKKSTVKKTSQRSLLFTAVTLFLITLPPGLGEGAAWWFRDVLGYTRQFETNLGVFGGVLSLCFLVFTFRLILRGHLGLVLILFNVILSILGSVGLGLWHGMHVWLGELFGIDPLQMVRYLAWINTAASSPFAILYGMIMFVFLAQYADDEGTATWFTVFASFFNLGITGSSLATGYLNQIFIVERGVYEELGKLMWTGWTIGLVYPVAIVLLFLTPWRKNSEPLAYTMWLRFRKVS